MREFTKKDARRIEKKYQTMSKEQFDELEAHAKLLGIKPPEITLGETKFMGLYDDDGNLITDNEEDAKRIYAQRDTND